MSTPERDKFNWGKAELMCVQERRRRPAPGMLVKPENFDPKKKYPMMVYIYERLSQNLHHFVDRRAGHSHQPDLLRQQRLPRADAGHRLHDRQAGAERAQVRAAGDPGGGRQGLRGREGASASRATVGADTRSRTW